MPADNLDYDVIIVGARVAGSILATLLGEAGFDVLILDRAHFPSDTLSTHFFRAPALRAFQQMGVFDKVQTAAPNLRVNYNVIDGIVFPEPVDKPADYPFYMCIRRITLDEILYHRVKNIADVDLLEGARVDRLMIKGGRINGVSWMGTDGRREARAKAVIGADGIYSFVAKQAQAITEHEEPVNRAMYYAYYRDFESKDGPAAEFHYRSNNLVYVFPCDGDLTLLAASVPIVNFNEFKHDPEG
jgi:2-polyprenyl-6-methoxyphenol hydroxylase-like FAD-dependent oxidoreductase